MRHNAPRCKLAIVSTYLPRRCGLATYTADLREALDVATDDVETAIVAIDRDGLSYGREVLATIEQDNPSDYSSVVDTLRDNDVDVVLIQHEYGIFGGPDGSNILELARALNASGIPYLLTLHTVLSAPSPGQAATLRALCSGASKIMAFTETARRVAIRTGIAAGHQLVVVPHGAPVTLRTAPDLHVLRPEVAELVLRLTGRPTLTTFGLLSEGKGIDIAIEALAAVVTTEPSTQYVIAGATHPEVKRHSGESYRDGLRAQVSRLNLDDNVHFVDAFLGLEDLSALLHASTLFVTPYRSAEQVCSGALTFALAAGLPVVSTAYRYAEDMLSNGAGRIVDIGDPSALAEEISGLLSNPAELAKAKTAAEAIASWLPWPTVAARQAELVRQIAARNRGGRATEPLLEAPPLVLDHLNSLTDEIGIIQFAKGDQPAVSSGYCVDDVARLAIVASDLVSIGLGPESEPGALAHRWLRQSIRFLSAAYDPMSRSMHNQLSYHGLWEDWPHLGDHVGRAMWSLGTLAGSLAVPAEVRSPASELLDALSGNLERLSAMGLRSAAYALLGLARARWASAAEPLVELLDKALRETIAEDPSWRWFEPELTYDNARLPQALLQGALLVGNQEAVARALTALDWYADHVRAPGGVIRTVGNVWHHRDDNPQSWSADDGDEQPIDPGALAEAFTEAWLCRGDPSDATLAALGLSWFLGDNRAGIRMYVDRTGACHDGMSSSWVNGNQGAESTLAYFQAVLALTQAGLSTMADSPSHFERSDMVSWVERPASSERNGRTLTARTMTTRPATTERSSPQRNRPPATGHRPRTSEGHSDAR